MPQVRGQTSPDAGREGFPVPNAKLGVWLLLVIGTVIFSALTSAYLVRMELPDWRSVPEPGSLAVNTALLALSSLFLQRSVWASRRGETRGTRANLQLGGLLALAFIGGQFASWAQLQALGYFLTSNPSSSFFYLITALHGLHLVGGLVAWAWVASRPLPAPLSVELCALYWHFLLVVWLALYGLLLLT